MDWYDQEPYEVYDREGNKVRTNREWGALLEDPDYKRVGSDVVGPYWISTVWLGHNHNFYGKGPPIIFETMVFIDPEQQGEDYTMVEFDCIRYATEAEAVAGHAAMVLLVRATTQEEPDGLRTGAEDGPMDEGGGRGDSSGDQEDAGGPARRGGPEVRQPGPGDDHRDPG